jgi:hypothetical protein
MIKLNQKTTYIVSKEKLVVSEEKLVVFRGEACSLQRRSL